MFRKPTSGLNRPCPLTSSTLSLTHTSQVPWYSDGVRPLNHRKPTRSRGLRTAKSSDPTKFSPANAKSRLKYSRGWWARSRARNELDREALKYLERVHLSEHINKYPAELSGGMQQ